MSSLAGSVSPEECGTANDRALKRVVEAGSECDEVGRLDGLFVFGDATPLLRAAGLAMSMIDAFAEIK